MIVTAGPPDEEGRCRTLRGARGGGRRFRLAQVRMVCSGVRIEVWLAATRMCLLAAAWAPRHRPAEV
ncbi:hypothetical protein GCM10015535_35260 [Streptomyces gelaticus]|uniref:Uncharacterized protein n=1 Tax=Streptomyces gelaticus TaxID=285446 RepID=A0ABQ2VZK7_9ACTN|nr:hypothetical protein GCM10015535_35260 [Streptomyces gelaticus]